MSGRPLVLLWADAWIDVDEARRLAGDSCAISEDRSDYERADAVIFPTPALGSWIPSERAFPHQLWVHWSQESAVHYPALLNAGFNARFDLQMTYRLDSDVPIPYFSPNMFDVRQPIVAMAHRQAVAVSAWISSPWDRCGRDDYLLALMKEIPTHSYGTVGRNCELAEDSGTDTKLATIRQYRFTIAFENSLTNDYVTEKFFQPLLVGSVPIYRGAPNVAAFAPAPHSYIDATDFNGPEELAQFVAAMTNDEYDSYHAWRHDGATDEWRSRFAQFDTYAFTRLARVIPTVAIGRQAAAASDRDGFPPRSGPGLARLPIG